MTNLSILQRNMLATMSQDAQALYLRGCERDEWVACKMAWEWDRFWERLEPMLRAALKIWSLTAPPAGLVDYFKERVYRRYFPDGRPPIDAEAVDREMQIAACDSAELLAKFCAVTSPDGPAAVQALLARIAA